MRNNRFILSLIIALIPLAIAENATVSEEEKRSAFWEHDGQRNLLSSLRLQKKEHKAKNVILFLGDGMGMTTVTATRIYKGQKRGKTGEEEHLTFDDFPYVSLSKTYGVDRQTSDSANTATAYLCGVKANYGTLGVDGRVQYENCESAQDNTTYVNSILKWAQDEGKWTGFVTSTRVTHATPAGLYAHSASRRWEAVTPSPKCVDIAQQLVHHSPGKDIHVIMGGGRCNFMPGGQTDAYGDAGCRNDSRNLIEEWQADKKSRNLRWETVFEARELRALQPNNIDYLLGLFHADHLPYVADRPDLNNEYPTLQEMTEMAIKILSRSPKGFFLLVEGGRIDTAHHVNWAMKSLEEGVEFDQAVQTGQKMTDENDTLIVVTADHSHTFTIGGDYPLRGSNVLGLGGLSDVDNRTFTTLGYHNGPGYKNNSRERNLTQAEAVEKDFKQDSLFPMRFETHGAEDVPVYARGPMAHLFHGVHEQSYIPYAMGYASCIGPNKDHCSGAWALTASQTLFVVKLLAIALLTYSINSKQL